MEESRLVEAIMCVKPRQESKEDWRREGERKRVGAQERKRA